jgi:hypothetical protein
MAHVKVHLPQGGDSLQIETGGKITAAGTQAAAITDALTAGSATAANCATTINLILAALRGVGVVASS